MNVLRTPDRVRERLRQSKADRDRAVSLDASPAPSAEARMGCTFTPGDRVFDRESGEEGEVIGGTVETIIRPATD